MLITKNVSPQKLSFLTALLIAIPISIGYYFLHPDWFITFVVFVLILFGSHFLIQFTMERFIFRKIKLIYKFIYQTKATKREETYYKYILPKKSIDEVRIDVENWAEQRQEEIELLKKNEAYRKEFLQNLSHEFKTPIFAIQGYVDTLLEGALSNPEVNIKFLKNASRNVDRLVAMVNDLDEITRLESGEQPLNKTFFIIQDLIREVYDSLSIKTAEQNIKCSIKKGCEQQLNVIADKEKIRQVIINLVSNATKYGKRNGNIIASIYNTDGKHVLVEISDDGIGIAEEHLPRIFERFYRVDPARSRQTGGTGLGLSIVKHVASKHGGEVTLWSVENVGSTFSLRLPIYDSQAEGAQ